MAHSFCTAVRRPGYEAKGAKHFGYHAAALISGTETVTIHKTFKYTKTQKKSRCSGFHGDHLKIHFINWSMCLSGV